MSAGVMEAWCVLAPDDGGAQDVAGVAVRCLPFRIGRGAGADLLLSDERVTSGCELVRGTDGRMTATSGGGVYVNGEIIREGHCQVLVESDRLMMAVGERGPGKVHQPGPTFRVRHLRDGGGAGDGDQRCGDAALKSMDEAIQCMICMCTVTLRPHSRALCRLASLTLPEHLLNARHRPYRPHTDAPLHGAPPLPAQHVRRLCSAGSRERRKVPQLPPPSGGRQAEPRHAGAHRGGMRRGPVAEAKGATTPPLEFAFCSLSTLESS